MACDLFPYNTVLWLYHPIGPKKKFYMIMVYGYPIYRIPTVIIQPYAVYSMVYSHIMVVVVTW